MKLSLIVAVADNGVIGRANALPWRLPNDLKHFKASTMGKPILMGRKTFDSLGKPLPGRTNIVITRQASWQAAGCVVVPSLLAAIDAAASAYASTHASKEDSAGEAMRAEAIVIGGAEIYRLALPLVQRVYLTQVHATIEGDAWFPELELSQWRTLSRQDHAADATHMYPYSFLTLERS